MTVAAMSAPEPRLRTPRWVLVLLIGSLALNLVVLGLVAGAVWRFRSPPPWAGAVTPNLLGYAGTLPHDRRRVLWDATADERRQVRPFRREVRLAREETLRMLVAEPFDKQRFVGAQMRQAEAENRARAAVQTLYAEIAAHMTPAERKAFPHWRDQRRPPGSNLLDEPDQQAKEPAR
jgi:uncharacterized membrane protein